MRLIDIDNLGEPDSEYDSYYDGWTAYSKLHLESVPILDTDELINVIKKRIKGLIDNHNVREAWELQNTLVVINDWLKGNKKRELLLWQDGEKI